jgi:hypothetical protein
MLQVCFILVYCFRTCASCACVWISYRPSHWSKHSRPPEPTACVHGVSQPPQRRPNLFPALLVSDAAGDFTSWRLSVQHTLPGSSPPFWDCGSALHQFPTQPSAPCSKLPSGTTPSRLPLIWTSLVLGLGLLTASHCTSADGSSNSIPSRAQKRRLLRYKTAYYCVLAN